MVREFGDERIVYAKNARNLGISASRNRLMEMARGEYLAVLDHDDICREDRLEKESAYLDSHPECGAVSSFCVHFPQVFLSTRPLTDRAIKLDLKNRCSMIHSASMLRASTLVENGIRYEEEYSPSTETSATTQSLRRRRGSSGVICPKRRWRGPPTTRSPHVGRVWC